MQNKKLDRSKVPLYDCIKKYAESGITSFHMPGHKMGNGMYSEFEKDIFTIDVTEVEGTDNLYSPEGAIKTAQEKAAHAFNVYKTYFLVNGSTSGIHSMIMSVCRPGDKIIVARDCHKSVINAIILLGLIPVFISPKIIDTYNISGGVDVDYLETVIDNNKDAKAVLITYPNYYGLCSDVESIARIVRKYNKYLLVDEAHGAHFTFSDDMPISAIEAGAHMSVQSAHKTLSALTQTAYLHVSKDFDRITQLEGVLSINQTSSPSYILMSSLDIARYDIETYGYKNISRVIKKCEEARKELAKENIKCIDDKIIGNNCIKDIDKTRLVVNFSNENINGFEMDRCLREKFNIQVEMADINNIVAICTLNDKDEDIEKLYRRVIEICKQKHKICLANEELNYKLSNDIIKVITAVSKMTPREAYFSDSSLINLEDSEGKISKSIVAPYPPGVPILCPGELIDRAKIDYINHVLKLGGHVNGIFENKNIYVVGGSR